MRRIWIGLTIIFIIIGTLLLWRSMTEPDDALKAGQKVVVQLQWFDQAQFAGFYVALQKGYYTEEGLRVELTPGSYSTNPIQQVANGNADIGLATGDQVLIQHAQRGDLRAVGTVFTHSVACFMSKQSANINAPEDLIGKKVGVYRNYDTENLLLAILAKHGIKPSQVDIVDAGVLQAFQKGELDVFPSYAFNEPLTMQDAKIPISLLFPDDFGIRSYSDTVFTTRDYLGKHRDTVIRFIRASRRGWDEALRDPEGALNIMFQVAKNLNPDGKDRQHQQEMLAEVLKRIKDGSDFPVFRMDATRWADMEKWLGSIGKINSTGNVNSLCDYGIAEGK